MTQHQGFKLLHRAVVGWWTAWDSKKWRISTIMGLSTYEFADESDKPTLVHHGTVTAAGTHRCVRHKRPNISRESCYKRVCGNVILSRFGAADGWCDKGS